MNQTPRALMLIDMQVDYFRDPELQRSRPRLIGLCNELMSRARAAGAPILEVRTIHESDRSTWSLNMHDDRTGMVLRGTRGAEPVAELRSQGAIRVTKTRDSAFHRTALGSVLRERNISTLAICGVSTESCIALTASEAYARDIRVTLVEDAIASADPQRHRQTLELLTRQYRQPAVAAQQVTFSAP